MELEFEFSGIISGEDKMVILRLEYDQRREVEYRKFIDNIISKMDRENKVAHFRDMDIDKKRVLVKDIVHHFIRCS